jgi:phosphatidate cytidylyltransferase
MDPNRVIVALVVGPVLLAATYLGGWFFFVPLLLLLLAAGSEYSRMMGALKHNTPRWLLLPAVALVLAAMWWAESRLIGFAVFISVFAALIYGLWLFERGVTTDAALDWFALVTGIVLLGWIGGHFFLLRRMPEDGMQWTMVALLGIWSADMAAYLVGSFLAGRGILGRHALSPRLSPKKTVEGYVGGIVAGTLVAVITALILDLPPLLAGLAGLAVSVLGLFGDLSISLLKREAGMKDSGKLFPGHGGALDRLDSLIWSAAIVYYLVIFLGPLFPAAG